ncbi:hypothetical protein [Microlunatus speluncae]|uniref:hypothetical protein n=1 Tax=Microlunatus speluncae TaxID=2594267 RepID=UPI0013757119|nr:hypothetical protein [Microlunatus speluncae]
MTTSLDDLRLRDFVPRSMLVAAEHPPTRPATAIVDARALLPVLAGRGVGDA